MSTNQIIEFFKWLWTLNGVRALTIHILVNLGVALAAALRTKTFKLHRISDFLFQKLAPYIIVYGIVKAIAMDTPMSWLANAAWVVLETTLLANLIENAEKLGLKLPPVISVLVSKLKNFTDPAV